jgi:ABC-type uncharacterized transport system auxiliary subunit
MFMKTSKLFLSVVFAILIAGCNETPPPPAQPVDPPEPPSGPQATSIAISPRLMHIDIGETQNVVVTVTPEDYDYQGKIDWQSDNTSIVTVTNGEVTGIADGQAKITATLDTVSASCTVVIP